MSPLVPEQMWRSGYVKDLSIYIKSDSYLPQHYFCPSERTTTGALWIKGNVAKLLTSHPRRAPATPQDSLWFRAALLRQEGQSCITGIVWSSCKGVLQLQTPWGCVSRAWAIILRAFSFLPHTPTPVVFCGLLCSVFNVTSNMKVIYKILMYLNKSPLPKSTLFKYPLQPNTCDKLRIIIFWCSLLLFTCNEILFHMKTLFCLKPLQHENSNLAFLN